jgi:hypothetical protein
MFLRHSVPTNINLETGIAYGYISANALDPDIVNDLQMNGDDVYYVDAVKEAQREAALSKEAQDEARDDCGAGSWEQLHESDQFDYTLAYVKGVWGGSKWEQSFNDNYQPDEPVHEGEIDYISSGVAGKIKWRTSWLGGALNVWIFESPFTGRFQQCSPCVPGAANLDNPDPDGILGYDVPPEWRSNDD